MTLEAFSKAQLADHFQLIDASGEISEGAVANLLRAPLARWGLSPKRTILQYARDQLKAAGLDDVACVSRILNGMIVLGECGETYVGHESYIAPAEPRWIAVGAGFGVILSVSGPPEGTRRVPPSNHRDIVQRIHVESDDDVAQLQLAGVREVSMSDWLTPLGYLRHATRRLRRPARNDEISLAAFWDLLKVTFAEEGLPLSSDAEIRAVVGDPGQFFGRYDTADPEGRWTALPPDGIWCAFRRGYGEKHWHPAIIEANGEHRRVLDLYNVDEWRWALLARGRSLGQEEVVDHSDGSVELTFPPPKQLHAAMDIVGVPASAWTWNLQSGGPNVWALVQ